MSKPIKLFSKLVLIVAAGAAIYFLFDQNQKHEQFLALRNKGIIVWDKQKAQSGLTLVNSRYSNHVKLMGMDGKIEKSWHVPDPTDEGVHFAKLDQDGNLIAAIQVRSLSKLSESGEAIWTKPINAHHDVAILEDGNYLTFDLNARFATYKGSPIKAFVDIIKKISTNGKLMATYKIDHLMEPYVSPTLAAEARSHAERNELSDIFHCNAIVEVPQTFSEQVRKGDILISCRDLNLLLITDPEFKKERWSFGPGNLEHQHDPSFLSDGTIMLLDNRPSKRRSRVIKVDINSKEITWEYDGEKFREFFTKTMGGVQQLDNENILVSLGNKGEVLEIAPTGKLVWRFRNPDYSLASTKSGRNAWEIYRATRYSHEDL